MTAESTGGQHRDSRFPSPGVSVVARQTGLAVGPLGVVRAVALARVVVAVALLGVPVAVTLAGHAAPAAGQGRAEAPGATVLTLGPRRPI